MANIGFGVFKQKNPFDNQTHDNVHIIYFHTQTLRYFPHLVQTKVHDELVNTLTMILSRNIADDIFLLGFHLLKKVLGERVFYSQGHPKAFITDNSDPMRKSLRTIYPESKQFLCVFHILQQVWRYCI